MSLLSDRAVDGRWRAQWCWSAERGGPGLSVRRFRKTFSLKSVPKEFIVHVSADSRYVLHVNGRRAGRGPLKGTLEHYHYESYDLAEFLRPGKNVLAAEVAWFGLNAPNSEMHSGYAGFLFQGPADAGLDTPGGWKVQADRAITPDTTPYIANASHFLGYLERVDGRKLPRGWTEASFRDAGWAPAVVFTPADVPANWGETAEVWDLHPRDLPALLEEPRRFARTLACARGGHGMKETEHLFGAPPRGWALPAGKGGELVLDAGALTTGFPELSFRGGAGRTVQVIYAEAVGQMTERGKGYRWFAKDIRDAIASGVADGYRDTLTLPGGAFRYEPLHWRTFWFVRLVVSPGPKAFALDDFSYRFCTYPQDLAASFDSALPDSQKMLELSWRTLQLCTHETYEDCPYYEQLHYIADARLEALQGLALAGDWKMPRRALRLFRDSLRYDGLLHCRVPSRRKHRLPYFALLWVLMLEDYWRWVGPRERGFVRESLFAADGVLRYFRAFLRDDAFVGPVPYWNPINYGGPALEDAVRKGGSTYLTALFVCALDAAVRLHEEAGEPDDAPRWRTLAARLRDAVRARAWSEKEGLFLEAPGAAGGSLSQHTNAQCILAGAATPAQTARILQRLAGDSTLRLTQTMNTYYVARALEQAGGYSAFGTALLAPWREQLAKHLSTWWETTSDGRSDCHAWSGWIAVDFLTAILGIQPALPGFAEILIRPQVTACEWAKGAMPVPGGRVSVSWRREGAQVALEAEVPAGVPVVVELPGVPPVRAPGGGRITARA